MKRIKRIIIIFAVICSSYILLIIWSSFELAKHQIADCGTLTVLTRRGPFIKGKARTYFIPGNYNSLRMPKDCFYTIYSGFFNYWEILCSCRDRQIVITVNRDEYYEINEQYIKNYSSEKIILERVEHKEFQKLKESGEYLYLSGD